MPTFTPQSPLSPGCWFQPWPLTGTSSKLELQCHYLWLENTNAFKKIFLKSLFIFWNLTAGDQLVWFMNNYMSISEVLIFFFFSSLFFLYPSLQGRMSKTGVKPGFQSMPGTQIIWFSLILDGTSQRTRCALGPREDEWEKESELSGKWARDSQDTIRVVRAVQCVRALNPWMPSWLQIEMLLSQNVLYFVLLSYPTAGWAALKLESSAISPQFLSPVPPFLLLLSLSLYPEKR